MQVPENQICALENSFYWSMKNKCPEYEGGDSACHPWLPLRCAIVLFNLP